MALISMAVYDTGTNNRAPLIKHTLESLLRTVDFNLHRAFLVINSSTEESAAHIGAFVRRTGAETLFLPENIGTARAINLAWKTRLPGEHAVKMDDDVVVNDARWADKLEDAINRDQRLGIIGLKRKDLLESPTAADPIWRSAFRALPHAPGQMCITVEVVNHVMGTCQMYSAALLDKIGYLYQPAKYGFDDSLSATRCRVAGFYNAFYCNVEIDHIDPGGNDYTQEKVDATKSGTDNNTEYHRLKAGYENGTIGIYYDEDGNNPTTLDSVNPRYNYSTR